MKQATTSARGASLVEVLLVISILGVLLSIAVPRYAAYLKQGKKAQCMANLSVMEKDIYLQYAKTAPQIPHRPAASRWDDPLWGALDAAWAGLLPAAMAVAENEPQCPDHGVYLVTEDPASEYPVRAICSIHGEVRKLKSSLDNHGKGSGDTGDLEDALDKLVYDFGKMKPNDLNTFDMSNSRGWKINEKQGAAFLEGSKHNNRIYLPNDRDEYTLTLGATLLTEKRWGSGYGVLFDTSLENGNPKKDSGFIMQFDKGYGNGELVLRKRKNGREYSPFARIDPGHSDFPWEHNYDPEWWNTDHEITLEVTRIDAGRKQVRIFIDGLEYAGDKPIVYESQAGDGEYTGLRVWGGDSQFDYLEIT